MNAQEQIAAIKCDLQDAQNHKAAADIVFKTIWAKASEQGIHSKDEPKLAAGRQLVKLTRAYTAGLLSVADQLSAEL